MNGEFEVAQLHFFPYLWLSALVGEGFLPFLWLDEVFLDLDGILKDLFGLKGF